MRSDKSVPRTALGGPPWPVLLMIREVDVGGTERQLTEVAKALDRHLVHPHVGCCISQGLCATELRDAGVPIVEFPIRSFASSRTFTAAMQMGRYLREHRIQLVHTFDVPATIFGVYAARLFRSPIVLSSQRAHRELTQGALLRLLRGTDRLVDGFVVNCQAIRHHLLNDEGIREDLIHVCYNGLDTARFRPEPRWRPPELKDASMVIGAACALRPEKGLSTLIDAFARVAHLHSDTRLLLIGDGPCRDELAQRCRDHGMADRCLLLPALLNVEAWLHTFDIFVLPSLSEALSNSIMEAMASGCAVIASRVGGNPELVIDQKTGLLFKAGNVDELAARLKLLIERPDLRSEYARAGGERMRRDFSLQQSVRTMQTVYMKFLQKQEPSTSLAVEAVPAGDSTRS